MTMKLSQCRKDPLSLELGEAKTLKFRIPEVTSSWFVARTQVMSSDGGCQGVARYSQHQIPLEPLSCWSRCLDVKICKCKRNAANMLVVGSLTQHFMIFSSVA